MICPICKGECGTYHPVAKCCGLSHHCDAREGCIGVQVMGEFVPCEVCEGTGLVEPESVLSYVLEAL